MNNEIIFMVNESLDSGYEAQALGFSIFTEAESLDELKNQLKDAVKCHFDDDKLPHIIRLHFVKEEIILV